MQNTQRYFTTQQQSNDTIISSDTPVFQTTVTRRRRKHIQSSFMPTVTNASQLYLCQKKVPQRDLRDCQTKQSTTICSSTTAMTLHDKDNKYLTLDGLTASFDVSDKFKKSLNQQEAKKQRPLSPPNEIINPQLAATATKIDSESKSRAFWVPSSLPSYRSCDDHTNVKQQLLKFVSSSSDQSKSSSVLEQN